VKMLGVVPPVRKETPNGVVREFQPRHLGVGGGRENPTPLKTISDVRDNYPPNINCLMTLKIFNNGG